MMTRELEQGVERLVAPAQVLAADVRQAAQISETSDTQVARRAYVRAAFALIECNLNLMADVVVRAVGRDEVHLEPAEIEFFGEKPFTSDKDGTKAFRPKFLSIQDRVWPTFELFSRLYGKRFRLHKGDTGWVRFTGAIKIRNRITHPKDATSFEISEEELEIVEDARRWFANSVEDLLDACG